MDIARGVATVGRLRDRGSPGLLLLVFGLVPVALAACGRSDSPNPKGPWKDMNHDERLAYMKKTVFPRMKAEFAAFDVKDFGEMNCATCHGDGAKDKTFKMPNPKLPKLPGSEEGFKKLSEEHPDVTRFMMTKVVPLMASFLGEEPYDPKLHRGFGCFRCHPKKE
jgi:hypothetical protein